MLRSQLLSQNPRLQACEVQDTAHVKLGDQGEFVTLIQRALQAIDNPTIADSETSTGRYGSSTAAAVLAYKTKRSIINSAYQTRPDDIVGKLTIKRMDDDMLAIEARDTSAFFAYPLRNAWGRTF